MLMPTSAQAAELTSLYNTCVPLSHRLAEAQGEMARILRHRDMYAAVSRETRTPWYVVAAIHALEADLNFGCHLHNGDPLSARTTHVPIGRPIIGEPPFTWEASAVDAIKTSLLAGITRWTLVMTLWAIESYNGLAYRKRDVRTPYLWAASQHYAGGLFVKDGVYSPTAWSKQIGAAVLLRMLEGNKEITLLRPLRA